MAAKRYTYTVKTPLGKALVLALIVGMAVFLFRLPNLMIGIDGTRRDFTGRKSGTSLHWTYSLFDGTSEQTFDFGENQTCLLKCTTDGGTLTVELRTDDGTLLLGEVFRTDAERTLTLTGDVTMYLVAENHSGSISLAPIPTS